MDVHIGVTYSVKELVVDVEIAADDLRSQIDTAFGGNSSVLWLTDVKGRTVGVPTDKIAYIEIGTDDGGRRVGFGR